MFKTLAVVALFSLSSCGIFEGPATPDPIELPANCRVQQVPEGVEYICTDRDGNVTSAIVKHGERGEMGPVGPQGEAGQGLAVTHFKQCIGSIEGWLEGSSYEVNFEVVYFETGDRFARSVVELKRDTEVINVRTASAFFLANFPHTQLADGMLFLRLDGDKLEVTSRGELSATIGCEVVE